MGMYAWRAMILIALASIFVLVWYMIKLYLLFSGAKQKRQEVAQAFIERIESSGLGNSVQIFEINSVNRMVDFMNYFHEKKQEVIDGCFDGKIVVIPAEEIYSKIGITNFSTFVHQLRDEVAPGIEISVTDLRGRCIIQGQLVSALNNRVISQMPTRVQ